MKKKIARKVSLGDVAREANVSKAAASFALQNNPGVSQATRRRVLRIAEKLGYAPDARIASMMSTIREAKDKELLPIAWLNTNSEEDAWRKYNFLSPYLEGARASALRLGYRIEEIWANRPDMTMRRISDILYQRGIEGVIVSHPARRFRLNWQHLAAVSLETSLLSPALDHVASDHYSNLLLALKMLRRFGYRRIGVCLDEDVDRHSSHTCRAALQYFQSNLSKSEITEPVFYAWGSPEKERQAPKRVAAWVQRIRPDVVVGLSCHLVTWMKSAGLRVPQDVGVVHIANDDDVKDWAGICSHRREVGAAAAEAVVALMLHRQFGLPRLARNTLIRGSWTPGWTLQIPKRKPA